MSHESHDFWLAAKYQGVCAQCGLHRKWDWEWDAHHVIEKQTLRQRGLPRWDARGALKLCNSCHSGQTTKLRKVYLSNLTDENVAYAFEVLGDYAYDYLHRHYEGYDQRVEDRVSHAAAT